MLNQDESLKRQIGLIGLLFTGITGIIGSGWLFASMFAAQIAGPAAIISWVIGGFIAITIALVYAELGGMFPIAGSLARIPNFSHGHVCSFMAGWLCWIAYVTTAPIEVMAVLDYASNYLPWLTVVQQGERVFTNEGILVAAFMMLIFTAINLMGVKWLIRANTSITFWKLTVPVIVPVILIYVGFKAENFTEFGGFAPHGVAGIFGAVSSGGVMFSLFGFRTVMDMAGEAKNPQRNVPLAMIGALLVSLVVYMMLQVSFIGVIPADHLSEGWSKISENVPGGPFAAFATILGLQWLAFSLYFDAVLSPSGTALAYTGVTARINYAMSKNGQLPGFLMKLNRFKVPFWSLLINFVLGMLIFLPFPSWSEIVGFISSAIIMSFAFGPVSLVALRHQAPEVNRPFRLPFGIAFSAISFVLIGFVVYWTGWETNWKVLLAVMAGLVLMVIVRMSGDGPKEPLNIKQSLWLWPYFVGLGVISYLGDYGHGRGVITQGYALIIITLFSLAIFLLASKLRFSREETRRLILAEK